MKILGYEARQGIPGEGPAVPGSMEQAGRAWGALEQGADQLSRQMFALDRKAQEDQKATDLSRATVSATAKLFEAQKQIQGDEDFGTYEQRMKEAAEKIKSEELANLRSDDVKQAFVAHFEPLALHKQAGMWELSKKKQYDVDRAQLLEDADQFGRLMSVANDDEEYRMLDDRLQASIMARVASGAIDRVHAFEILKKTRQDAETDQLLRDSIQDPAGTLTKLKDDANYHPGVDQTKKLRMVEHLQSVVDRQEKKSTVQLRQDMEDNLTSIRNTGVEMPGVATRVLAAHGEEAGNIYQKAVEREHKYYDVTQNIAYLPADQAAEKLKALEPQPGAAGYADDLKLYGDVSQYLAKREKLLKDDPVMWVRNAPEAKTITDVLQLQETMGVDPESRRALTNDQAARVVTKFNSLPADQRVEFLDNVMKEAGENWGYVKRDLVRAKMSPENEVLIAIHDLPWAPAVLPVLSEAIKQGDKVLKESLGNDVVKQVEDGVREEMAEFRETIIKGDYTGARIPWANDIQKAVTNTAFVYTQMGMKPKEAAVRAVDEIITRQYHEIDSTYRVPKGVDADKVKDYGKQRMWALEKMEDLVVPGSSNPELKPADLRKDYIKAVWKKGYWVTNEDESGLVLLDPLGLPVTTQGGKRVEFSFDEAEKMVQPKEIPNMWDTGLGRKESKVGGKSGIILGYDITPYATDPTHETRIASMVDSMGEVADAAGAEAYIRKKAPKSPLTGEMVAKASAAFGTPISLMLALMDNDSKFGTLGKGARTFNPGNVGNDDEGNMKDYGDWQSGVNAVAKWLSRHKTKKTAVA